MRGDVGSRFLVSGFALLVLLAPLPFGSVHRGPASVLVLAIATLAFVWIARGAAEPPEGMPRAVPVLGAAVLAWLSLALLPMPTSVLETLSPATVELRRATVERLLPAELRPLSANPFETQSQILRYAAYGTALFLAAVVPSPARLLRVSVISGVAVSLLAIIQGLTWNGKLLWFFEPYEGRTYHPRLSGPFVNADHFALFLEMALVVGGAWLLRSLRRGERGAMVPLALGLGVIAAGLLGSASRGGISGAAVGLAVFVWGARPGAVPREVARSDTSPSGRRRRRRAEHRIRRWRAVRSRADLRRSLEFWTGRLAPAAVLATIVLGGLVYAGPQSRELLDLRLGRTITNPDLHVRTVYWSQTIPMIADFPLFGVGAGAWRDLFPRYARYPMPDTRPNHAHGDYVEWAAEMGLVGWVLSAALALSVAAWARRNEVIPRTWRWGIVGALAAVAWHETFDFGLRVPANALLFAVLAGLLCNRRWKPKGPEGASVTSDAAARAVRFRSLRAAAAVCCVLLAFGSFIQLQESLRWAAARAGATAFEEAPRDPETWYEIGANRQQTLGRYAPETAAAFTEAVRRRPAFAHAWWRLSRSSPTFARREQALESALYLDPTEAAWRIARVHLLAATGRVGEIPAEIEEAVFLVPRLAEHPYLDPVRATPSDGILEAAARGFERAIELHPGDPHVLASAASLHFRFERWERAAALYERAATVSGDWSRYGLSAGESHVRAGDLETAERSFRRAIAAEPSHPDGYQHIALAVLRVQARWAEAETILERGVRRVSDPVPLLTTLHEIRAAGGDREGALEALERAAETHGRDAALQARLGDARFAAGDLHRAKIAYDRAVALEPERPDWHARRGKVLEGLYDLAGARDAYARAVELDPRNEAFAAQLARVELAFPQIEGKHLGPGR